eukprot:225498_1
MSLSDAFVKLVCERKFNNYFPKPSYHPTNKDLVILSTNYCEGQDILASCEGNENGIYEYNTKRNTFNRLYAYDQKFKPFAHGQFIDAKNELLHIFGNGKLGIFDLNTKIMNTNTTSALR